MDQNIPADVAGDATDADLRGRLSRLSLVDKVRLLSGAGFWALHPLESIGLRRMVTSDGPAGVRGELWDERSPSVNVPCPTALAATWDTVRVERLGRLLAAECRRKNVDVLLAPTVNLHRSPYAGRHFECFSEDPVLTADIGSAFVRGVQSQGVAATVKHFVANDSEDERYVADMRVDERTLRELYLHPFEVIVREAGAWLVMAAYNSVNGTTMTESPMLREVLHGEWSFDGVTISDWYAGRSTDAAARGGLDLMMPGPLGPWRDALVSAVEQGRVEESVIDGKVLRILRLAGRVGALDGVAVGPPPQEWADAATRRELRSAAAAGFVLLRNAAVGTAAVGTAAVGKAAVGTAAAPAPVLPLSAEALTSLAVIGPNAARGRPLGGGSALVFPPYTVSPLAGLQAALGASVRIEHGVGVRLHTRLPSADVDLLRPANGDANDGPDGGGVSVRFLAADGTVLGQENRRASSFNWHGVFGEVAAGQVAGVEVRCRLTARGTGPYTVGASGLGRFRLHVGDVLAFDVDLALPPGADPVEALMAPPQHGHVVSLTDGQQVDLVLLHEPTATASYGDSATVAFQLNLDLPYAGDDAEIDRAVGLAAAADAVVVVVGTTEEVESEGFDRSSLSLPGRQDELVRRVAAVNPRIVVVVNAGAPVLLPWRESVPAILLTWFPGQEFGNALADVLLGHCEAGGRLPTTWPAMEDSTLPTTHPVDGVLAYDETLHIGHRRFLRAGAEPAYWFGHGLGYTTWDVGPLDVQVLDGEVTVTVGVCNTGLRAGREVVQLYLSRPDSALDRPLRWLAGYAAVVAGPGEEQQVRIGIPRRRFAHWSAPAAGWEVEPGAFQVQVASSAADVRASAWVVVG